MPIMSLNENLKLSHLIIRMVKFFCAGYRIRWFICFKVKLIGLKEKCL